MSTKGDISQIGLKTLQVRPLVPPIDEIKIESNSLKK